MDDTHRQDEQTIAAAASLGIAIHPDWLPAVRFHLGLVTTAGLRVLEWDAPDETDPAPVFTA